MWSRVTSGGSEMENRALRKIWKPTSPPSCKMALSPPLFSPSGLSTTFYADNSKVSTSHQNFAFECQVPDIQLALPEGPRNKSPMTKHILLQQLLTIISGFLLLLHQISSSLGLGPCLGYLCGPSAQYGPWNMVGVQENLMKNDQYDFI